MLQCIQSNDQQSTASRSNLSDNASTARSRAQFPKSCRPANNREFAVELCRPIAQRNCPTAPTIPRLPLSNRTSWDGSQYSRFALIKTRLPLLQRSSQNSERAVHQE